MRFSIISGARQRADQGESAAEAWSNCVNDILLAEQLGYDAGYVGEHHFCYAWGNSSPLVMLAEIAAKTERIRIGTSVICAPFHNPLRLAEDIAAVDIVSKGRFDLGIGVGSTWEEFETFGISPKERFGRTWEVIDIIERCLHGGEEQFSHEGKYYNFPNVRWIIPPVQERIPIFWGGIGPQGAQRAAERGYNLIAPDWSGAYSRTLRERGRRPEDYLVGFYNALSIAPTREQAFEAVAEPCLWQSNIYALRRDLDGVTPPETARITMEDIRRGWETGEDTAFTVPRGGTVEDAINYFLPLVRGEGELITHFGLLTRLPGVKTEDAHRTMTLFAQEVMPVLKAEATKMAAERDPTSPIVS